MSTRLRIVTVLVLSLLLQAVAPAYACTMAAPADAPAMQDHAQHAMPAGDPPATSTAHDCCAGDDGGPGCGADDCAMGNCLAQMLPVYPAADAVPQHAPTAVPVAAFVPPAPPDSRFRPPIA